MTNRFSPKARLRIAAVAAIVTVTAAVVTVIDAGNRATPVADGVPLWSVDAAEVLGREFAVFRSPLTGTDFNMEMGGFIDADSTIVTMVGMPNRQAYSLDDAELVGLDAADGTVRWRTSAADIGGCSPTLLDGSVFCFSGPYVSVDGYSLFDIESGDRKDIAMPWSPIIAVVSGDDVLALEGDIESNDVRVHSGTVDDPDANWSNAFDVGGSWESGYSEPILSVRGNLGLISLDETLGFDPKTGEQKWLRGYTTCSTTHTSSDGVTLVSERDCEGDGQATREYALDEDGHEFAQADAATTGSNSYFEWRYSHDDPTESAPIILGDSGFDRKTGEKLWTNREVFGVAQSLSVIGDVVAVSGSETGIQFVDLFTGEVLWSSSAERAADVFWQGDVVVDEGIVYGADLRTGERTWEVRVEPDGEGQFDTWATPRELWAGEQVLLRSSEDRIIAVRAN
ncbi:outer membrane protein assembly factor BamB family protein [Rhodococcus sp. OK302]|uniref:outer membrane protein assembly factor BamB family protein n=1 Tax=Rhodococcus sp. OK302 TaxID=1882769 RepID=UPI000B94127F|nr:PQQ-binding-like beta-propeller repeat protein [Rhodococcus sp. OK302]OYD68929.1 putative pyrroloquinoline-quinone binding quinoprotein [Rhodococcus sp. OK302]